MNATIQTIAEIDADYYRDTSRVSNSMLRVFRESPLLYRGRFLDGTIQPDPPTDAMRLGVRVMDLAYRPEFFAANYIEIPKCDRRTKEGKAAYARFEEEAEGKELIQADDMVLIRAVRDGLLSNPQARQSIESPGDVELPLMWVDAESGLPCKAKVDKVFASGLVIDLKTTSNPSPRAFAKSMETYGYHHQAAHYLAGARGCLGHEAPSFLFVVVGTKQPHECILYQLDDEHNTEWLRLGERENRESLAELARRLDANDWSSRYEGVENEIPFPRWKL